MKEGTKWFTAIVGGVFIIGTLLFVAIRGGDFNLSVWGQSVGAHIPGPALPPPVNENTVSETSLVPPPVPIPSIIGTWRGKINLDGEEEANVTIRFLPSGQYEIGHDASHFDPGMWVQSGRRVAWRSSSDTEYIGSMRGEVIQGTSRNPGGRFRIVRVVD